MQNESSNTWYTNKLKIDPHYNWKRLEQFQKKHPNYTKEKYQSDPDKIIQATKKWRQKNLEKSNAGFAARRAKIPLKDHCEKCGTKEKRLIRHHEDYSKPLEFLTVCCQCHKRLHADLRRQGVTIPSVRGIGHCGDCAKTWPNCEKSRPLVKGYYRCTCWTERKGASLNEDWFSKS